MTDIKLDILELIRLALDHPTRPTRRTREERVYEALEGAGYLTPTAPPPDLSAYLTPVPEGYQTVIGWHVTRGSFPEDMGSRDGLRLWRLTKPGGSDDHVVGVKVRAPRALSEIDVCGMVWAYPIDWLDNNLEA